MASRWRTPFRPMPLLLALLALVALAPGVRAQNAIWITEPASWQGGMTDTIQPGAPLHVTGFARHSSGVKRVLVNGSPVRTEVQAGTLGLVRFETSLVAAASTREVTIVVEPKEGLPLTRTFRVAVLAAGGAKPPARAPPSTPGARDSLATVPDSVARRFPVMPTIVVSYAALRPWRSYAVRGIGYALLIGAGSYLTTIKKSSVIELCTGPPGQQDCVDRTTVSRPHAGVGIAVAAGAAFGGLLDAALTWRRAHALRAQRREHPPARTGFGLPAIEPDALGVRVALLRLRF